MVTHKPYREEGSHRRAFIAILISAIVMTAVSGEALDNPIEVGDVQWGRDLESALKNSADTAKPVLVLFKEIPGCSGKRKFGREVLTQPSLVEAIENEFHPVPDYLPALTQDQR